MAKARRNRLLLHGLSGLGDDFSHNSWFIIIVLVHVDYDNNTVYARLC